MRGAVFFETLRRSWQSMLWWGLGLGALAFLVIIIVPEVQVLEQMARMMETLPPILIQALGGGDIAYMATPEGYLSVQYFGFILLIFAVYAVISGLNVTANDEERGTLDVVLSLPLPRERLVLEKFLAYALLTVGIIAISFVCMWAAILLTPALAIDLNKLVIANINILPSTLLVLSVTILLSSVLRRRSHTIALASAFVIASYFLDTLGRAAPDTILEPLSYLSFFRYYDVVGIMQHGITWSNVLLLLAATAFFLATGVWFFRRRDVGL